MEPTPADALVTQPVDGHACFRLIRPGQTYYLTMEQEVLCADCALDEAVIRVRDDLAVLGQARSAVGETRQG